MLSPPMFKAPRLLAPLALSVITACLAFGSGAACADTAPEQSRVAGPPFPSLAPMLKRVLPAVVNISITAKVRPGDSDSGSGGQPDEQDQSPAEPSSPGDQPGGGAQEAVGIGSGVIVDAANGYIVTNNHVVEDADSIKVTLNDDREFDAKLIGKDPPSDLAVIQIKADNLAQLPIADSSKVEVGDYVAAIGSPFSLNQTVTSGIVSALGRDTPDNHDSIQEFIQTDASINPGNSGGALVNLQGELIGIPSQILSRSGGNIGIGFAIPTDLVKSVMAQLIATGSVSRGRIGLALQELTPELARAFDLPDSHGALVTQVEPGSTAEQAGIKPEDVVVNADGHKIQNIQQLHNYIGSLKIGTRVTLKLIRAGHLKEISLEVGKAPASVVAANGKVLESKLAGVVLNEVSNGDIHGLLVRAEDPNSEAAQSGLRPGDVITELNNKQVATVEEFNTRIAEKSKHLLLLVHRGPNVLFVALK